MKNDETIKYAIKCFADHKATFTQINEYTQEIEWCKPGTSAYYMRFLLSGNRVFVCGDMGDAVYRLTERAAIDKIANGYDLSYFTGKLTASENGKYCFDTDTAIERLEYHKQCDIEDCEEDEGLPPKTKQAYDTLIDNAKECHSVEEWREILREYQEDAEEISCDWWEWMPGAGNQLRQSVVMYWVALKMAAKQLGHEIKYIELD